MPGTGLPEWLHSAEGTSALFGPPVASFHFAPHHSTLSSNSQPYHEHCLECLQMLAMATLHASTWFFHVGLLQLLPRYQISALQDKQTVSSGEQLMLQLLWLNLGSYCPRPNLLGFAANGFAPNLLIVNTIIRPLFNCDPVMLMYTYIT